MQAKNTHEPILRVQTPGRWSLLGLQEPHQTPEPLGSFQARKDAQPPSLIQGYGVDPQHICKPPPTQIQSTRLHREALKAVETRAEAEPLVADTHST